MYTVGKKVVHPMHGAGVIEEIVSRNEKEGPKIFYLIRFSVGSLTLLLPCDNCEAVGLRQTMTPEEAEEMLASLDEAPVEYEHNWSQRYKENMARIRSGDMRQVAVVIRTLRRRDKKKNLSTGERKMLSSAKKIVISELALVLDREYSEIEHIIDTVLV
ncbi:MAG: CarD family transcriptional regulator [Clostridiaceae bacterium]|jgi:CarD family transcriptional regulator|nr:CarD family transcriptional regulator [Clostridiaceae bacterium]